MEGNGGLTTLTKHETDNLVMTASNVTSTTADHSLAAMSVSGKYNSYVIAQVIQMDISEFNRYNPNFDRQLSATGNYEIKLPTEKLTLFQANKPQILEQSIKLMLSNR
jgi:membrane-bound lytic murein transglycosylase D